MTFQQLYYLAEISKAGSINKAAQNLFLSQSNLSCSMRELENEFGITLFERGNRGVALTREGREFLGYANGILAQKEQLEGMYRSDGKGRQIPLQFSVSTQRYPFTEDAFIRLLKDCASENVHFSLKESGMYEVIEDVNTGKSDLGVIFISALTEKMIKRILRNKNLEWNMIRNIAPCLFVRRGHPLAAKDTVRADDMEGYAYLSYEHGPGVEMDFAEEVRLLGFKEPGSVINVNNRAGAVNIIAETNAVTTGSGLLVKGLMDTRMISIPLEGESDIHLGWIKNRRRGLSETAKRFVSLLEHSIADSAAYTEEVRKGLAGSR